jgi:hypothetical protein
MLTRLLNPDYYGRLGGACFYTLLLAVKRTNDDKKNLLRFVLEWEFGKERIGVDLRKLSDGGSGGGRRKNSVSGSGGQPTSDDASIQIGVNAAQTLAASSSFVTTASASASGGTVDVSWLETELVGPWMGNFARSKESWNGEKLLKVKPDGRVSRERWNEDNAIILDDPPESYDVLRNDGEGTSRPCVRLCTASCRD